MGSGHHPARLCRRPQHQRPRLPIAEAAETDHDRSTPWHSQRDFRLCRRPRCGPRPYCRYGGRQGLRRSKQETGSTARRVPLTPEYLFFSSFLRLHQGRYIVAPEVLSFREIADMLKPNFEGFPIPSRTIPKASTSGNWASMIHTRFAWPDPELYSLIAIAAHVCCRPSHDGYEHGMCSALHRCSNLVQDGQDPAGAQLSI